MSIGYRGMFCRIRGDGYLCRQRCRKDRTPQSAQNPVYERDWKIWCVAMQSRDACFLRRSGSSSFRSAGGIYCGGTPPQEDGSADLSYVEGVAREIAKHLTTYKVIVTKSTVPVGTGERVRALIEAERKEGVDFDIVSNPEFSSRRSRHRGFHATQSGDYRCAEPAGGSDHERPLSAVVPHRDPFVITTVETAELIKYAANSFLR